MYRECTGKEAWNFYKRVHKPGMLVRFKIKKWKLLCLPKSVRIRAYIAQ